MAFKRMNQIEKTVLAEIAKFSESELKKLIQECNRLTRTNCSWIKYGLKNIVAAVAKSQLKWQQNQQKAQALNPKG